MRAPEPIEGAGPRTYAPAMEPATPKIGIVTTSDRASRGEYRDQGTPELAAVLQEL